MELDTRRFAEGATFETDVCIVGAGPAGIALAHELGADRDVLLLESGGPGPEPEIQSLNDGALHGGDLASPQHTRRRGLGGTATLWNTALGQDTGVKLLPLDPIDFEERSWLPHSGWPFGAEELRPYYERAQRLCGIGPFAYEAAAWTRPECRPFPMMGSVICTRVYQLGRRGVFPEAALEAVRSRPGLRLCLYATVVRLETAGSERRVSRALVASPGGLRWSVRARRFVLAAGAIENARLLLVSGDTREGLGNTSGWLGRGFMEHPRDRALILDPASRDLYARSGFYDLHAGGNGTPVVGRLALREDLLRAERLLNASATLLPRPRAGAAWLHSALGRTRGLWRLQARLPSEGYGWSRVRAPDRWFSGFVVLLNLEQAPHPDNRVCLGSARDALGVPQPELHWRWRQDEQVGLERVRSLVAREIETAGLGRVVWLPDRAPDPNAHHHAGTTRMHADPAHGVVDAEGRVHGVENLYVCGASLFPTAGFANPVLTIVALASRLADHLSA